MTAEAGRWAMRRRGGRVGAVGALFAVLMIGATPPVATASTLSDLRVRSEATETVVEATLTRDAEVSDRTEGGAGSIAVGADVLAVRTVFADEIRLALPGTTAARAASVIVGDPFVSEVRVRPTADGSVFAIFVRRQVHYEVRRPADRDTLIVRIWPIVSPHGSRARHEIGGPDAAGEVTLDAESVGYDQQANVLHARGGVAITRPGTSLTADEVRVNRATYKGEARGDVVLRTDDVTLRGEYVQIDLEDETATVEHGEVELPRTGYRIAGGQLEKGYGQTYRIRDGVLTTCRCGGLEPPSWSIGARELDVDLYGTGTARGTTFRIRDVPVFYSPYGVFPVNRTRHTGFLMPRFGQSFSGKNPTGFEYEQPFYWAISKSQDATLAFRVETEARIGGVTEYRYALDRKSRGTIAGTFFSESIRKKDPEFNERAIVAEPANDRWAVFTRMRQELPFETRGYADTMVLSDDLYFREVDAATFEPGEDSAARTSFYTATRVGALKPWRHASVWGEATYYQDLDVRNHDEDRAVLQRVPVVEMHARESVLGDRVTLGIAGQSINYQRDVGFDGMRFDLNPHLRVPFHAGRMLFGALEGSVRGTLYQQTDTDLVARVCVGGPHPGTSCTKAIDCGDGGSCEFEPTGERLDPLQAREAVQLGWNVGTSVARVFPFRRWGIATVKHSIEPTVSYLYTPRLGDQETLPLYDGIDRVNRRSLFSYGIVSRLKVRREDAPVDAEQRRRGVPAAASVREVARVSILQAYDTEREIADGDHVSDVDLGVRLVPHDVLALQYGAIYNVSRNHLKGTSVTMLVREPWQADSPQLATLQRPSELALTYRFVDENVSAAKSSPGVEDLNGALYLRVARYLGLIVYTRFNLREAQAFEKGIGARFVSRCDCWMVEVGIQESDTPEPSRSVRLQVALAGIGAIGRSVLHTVQTPGFRRDQGWP